MQYGAPVDEHGSVVAIPLSPLQPTQELVVGSQTGVIPLHVLLEVHWTQRPASGPLVAQIVERQTVVPSPALHGPSPFLDPQALSTSQTPETHARDPIVVVQVPPGTGSPFATFAWQTPAAPLRLSHHLPAPHSASVVHVLPQTPVVVLQNGPA
jgi:hypothetical protein